MPHFSLNLLADGPIVTVVVGISEARAKALGAAGNTLPSPVPIRALLDTGASCTCLDPSVFAALGLTPTGSVNVNTPSTGATPHVADQYDISLAVSASSGPPLLLLTVPAIACELLASQGFHALIGRDILESCILIYNGQTKSFTLAY